MAKALPEGDTIAVMKKLAIILIILVIGLIVVGTAARAISSSEHISQSMVSQNCQAAQSYLRRVQKPRDLRARVDRLQAYRYIYSRLDIFIERLEHNNQPHATKLRKSAEVLNVTIDSFKNDYETYDQAREAVSNLKDCTQNPNKFIDLLTDARQKRKVVDNDVKAIQTALRTDIANQLNSLYKDLLATDRSSS